MTRVEIGAWDWQRPDWMGTYYPSDLPDDWRPAYYANDFACVGLPSTVWQPTDLSLWQHETGDELVFWLGCGPKQLDDPDLAEVLAALGPRLAGVYFENAEQKNAQAGAQALMKKLHRAASVVSYAADPALPGIELPWRGTCSDRSASLGIYRPQPGDDVRTRRELIELFADAPGPGARYLLIDGPPEIAEECRQLCGLLGI